MPAIDPTIVCCYLYTITRHGYPPPAERTEDYLREMQALGFRSVELEGIREAHLLAVYEHRSSIRATLDALDLQVPYFCVVLPGLSSPDAAVRAHNLQLFEKGCAVAHLFGARGVLDNAPLPPYQFPGDVPVVRHYDEDVLLAAALPAGLHWPSYWDDLAATYRQACDVAAGYGLTYQMHPCLGVLSSTTDAFLYFYDAVGRDNLRFNLDTANQYAMKDNLALSLRRLAGLVDYIHLSDNGGQRVEHLPPGEGAIRWDVFFETLEAVGFDGHVGLDIGGAESGVADLDGAYAAAARWLAARLHPLKLTASR
jgi:sugar phosphate isomerase/epimerase